MDDLSSGTADNNAAHELYLKCKLRLAKGGFNLRKFMSNSSQLTERIQQNEARISAPAIYANTEHMNHPSDLSKEDSVIEEDKTYKECAGNYRGHIWYRTKGAWCKKQTFDFYVFYWEPLFESTTYIHEA